MTRRNGGGQMSEVGTDQISGTIASPATAATKWRNDRTLMSERQQTQFGGGIRIEGYIKN